MAKVDHTRHSTIADESYGLGEGGPVVFGGVDVGVGGTVGGGVVGSGVGDGVGDGIAPGGISLPMKFGWLNLVLSFGSRPIAVVAAVMNFCQIARG